MGGWDSSAYHAFYPSAFTRSAGPLFPLAKHPDDTGWKYGSLHTQIVLFAFGDGGVRSLSVFTPAGTLALLANRADGQAIGDY